MPIEVAHQIVRNDSLSQCLGIGSKKMLGCPVCGQSHWRILDAVRCHKAIPLSRRDNWVIQTHRVKILADAISICWQNKDPVSGTMRQCGMLWTAWQYSDQDNLSTYLYVGEGVADAPFYLPEPGECIDGESGDRCECCHRCCICRECSLTHTGYPIFVCAACGCRAMWNSCGGTVCMCVQGCECPRCCETIRGITNPLQVTHPEEVLPLRARQAFDWERDYGHWDLIGEAPTPGISATADGELELPEHYPDVLDYVELASLFTEIWESDYCKTTRRAWDEVGKKYFEAYAPPSAE